MDETDSAAATVNPEPPVTPGPGEAAVPPPLGGYVPAPQYAPPQPQYGGSPGVAPVPQGAPGIGIAGFVCVIVGLFVPLVGLIGLILSILGYAQAKREGRPRGLALAGMIIGIVATVIGIILIVVFLAGTTTSASSGSISASQLASMLAAVTT